MKATGSSTEGTIWNYFCCKGFSPAGVAGLMGNLYAESGLNPINLQNTYEKRLGLTDAEYTAAVDSGGYPNFVRNSAGYGLAQWTYFMFQELKDHVAVFQVLRTARTVKEASDIVLTKYERPADMSNAVKVKRAGFGQAYYDTYANTTTTPEKEEITMSNSPLVTYTNITKNKTSPRNHAIDTITIHCIVGQWTAKQGCDFFATYAVTDAAYAALIKLIADICKRNGIKKLIWSTNKADRVNHANGCNMTVHRDYANKACPGQYLYDRHGAIAAAVNKLLGSGTTQPPEAAPGAVQGFPATPFTVRVIIPDLNYRKGPGMSYAVRGQTGKGVFTITEVQDGWGKLKSGAGWIYLESPDYCTIQGVAAKPAEPDPADVLAQEIAGKVKGSGLDPADVLNRTKKILGVA